MHAIRQYEFGPADVLRFEEVTDPHPARGQVRIAVTASGVHLIDTRIRAGEQAGPFALPELPMTPGREVAGVVDELGPGVDPSWLGRRVVAHLGQASGGYAELALREVDALHAIPDGVGDDVAVAMIGTGRTALAILDAARLTADDVVLISAAAGGLGSLLVQAGRAAGATVLGLAGGAAKVARVRDLGADHAVDYTTLDWPAEVRAALGGRAPTVVLDGVGGEIGSAALELLPPGGRAALFGWSSGAPIGVSDEELAARGVAAVTVLGPALMARLREFEERALAAAARGDMVPVVSSAFPLADAAGAHRALESRGTVGKVLLKP